MFKRLIPLSVLILSIGAVSVSASAKDTSNTVKVGVLESAAPTMKINYSDLNVSSPDGARVSRQRACSTCFTRVYNTNTARPGLAVVRAGTLDRSDELKIVAHIWTKRKLAGIEIPVNVPSWPEGAPPADFIAALTRE